ncbi:glycosyltransferase family 4 protein [Ruminococcaceae bacterium OttesenSCG-928-A16]|nr:glycosyltransferase family 4 protein [Ruminococcaceae bacterium OttesenSCG-928-A16]
MKVVITTVQVPFVEGGAERCAVELKNALIKTGHTTEIITMPFMDYPPENLTNHMAAARLINVNEGGGGVADLCIALKFPAYFMPHDNKVIWALHQHRAVYDLFDTELSRVRDTPEGRALRDVIVRADNAYLPEAKRIYTIAENVAVRMKRYNNITATPLYHPCPGMQNFYADAYEDYILMPSRINATKRQSLALEALRLCKQKVHLYLVGRADQPGMEQNLRNKIREYGLESRVRLLDFVPEEEKLELYAKARAVLFIPVDEDYGYITLEAMAAARPVITAADSGGPLEFVQDGITGMITQPTPEEIAKAMDELWKHKKMAKQFGEAGKKHLAEMNINWEHVVKELTRP